MIQTLPIVSSIAPALPVELLSAIAPDGAQGTDFGTLLAVEAGQIDAAAVTNAPSPAPAATLPGAAIAAAALPESGKTLPEGLPVETELAPEQTMPKMPAPALGLRQALKATPRAPAQPVAGTKPEEPEPTAPQVEDSKECESVAAQPMASAPSQRTVPLALLPVTLSAPTAVQAQFVPQPDAEASGAAPRPPAHPAAPQLAALPALPHAAASHPTFPTARVEVKLPEQAQALGLRIEAAAPGAPAPATPRESEPRLHLALPRAAEVALPERAVAEAPQLRTEPVRAELPTLAATPTPAAPAPSAPAPTLPAIEIANRPHDFTAMVDRLVAAREAAQPLALGLSVPHAEFGRVRIRFQTEREGLTATLASSDPDFARAVNAAPVPVLPVVAIDPAQLVSTQSSARSEPQQGQGQPQSQSRGGASEQRDPRGSGHDQPAPGRHPASEPRRRGGIFA